MITGACSIHTPLITPSHLYPRRFLLVLVGSSRLCCYLRTGFQFRKSNDLPILVLYMGSWCTQLYDRGCGSSACQALLNHKILIVTNKGFATTRSKPNMKFLLSKAKWQRRWFCSCVCKFYRGLAQLHSCFWISGAYDTWSKWNYTNSAVIWIGDSSLRAKSARSQRLSRSPAPYPSLTFSWQKRPVGLGGIFWSSGNMRLQWVPPTNWENAKKPKILV